MSHVRKFVITLAVTLSLLVTGVAFAAWLASGEGDGFVDAGEALAVTTEAATAVGTLVPGGEADVVVRVHNPNAFAVKVTAITPKAGEAISSDAGAACDASTGVTFAGTTGLAQNIAAGSSVSIVLADAASMSNASDNSCQNATFTIPVDIAAESNA